MVAVGKGVGVVMNGKRMVPFAGVGVGAEISLDNVDSGVGKGEGVNCIRAITYHSQSMYVHCNQGDRYMHQEKCKLLLFQLHIWKYVNQLHELITLQRA